MVAPDCDPMQRAGKEKSMFDFLPCVLPSSNLLDSYSASPPWIHLLSFEGRNASCGAQYLLHRLEYCDTVEDAVADCSCSVAFTRWLPGGKLHLLVGPHSLCALRLETSSYQSVITCMTCHVMAPAYRTITIKNTRQTGLCRDDTVTICTNYPHLQSNVISLAL